MNLEVLAYSKENRIRIKIFNEYSKKVFMKNYVFSNKHDYELCNSAFKAICDFC